MQERARYYCVVFLNQLALSHKEAHGGSALAKKLIDLYFTLFKMLVEGNIGRAAEVKKVQAGLHHTAGNLHPCTYVVCYTLAQTPQPLMLVMFTFELCITSCHVWHARGGVLTTFFC